MNTNIVEGVTKLFGLYDFFLSVPLLLPGHPICHMCHTYQKMENGTLTEVDPQCWCHHIMPVEVPPSK